MSQNDLLFFYSALPSDNRENGAEKEMQLPIGGGYGRIRRKRPLRIGNSESFFIPFKYRSFFVSDTLAPTQQNGRRFACTIHAQVDTCGEAFKCNHNRENLKSVIGFPKNPFDSI